jgi:hypothetical protein
MAFRKTRTAAADDDPGLLEIAAWINWFRSGHMSVIAANVADGSMRPSDRAAAEAEANRLADAFAERMVHDYRIRKGLAPR